MDNRIIVQFDVDGVLAEFTEGFTKLAHEMGFGNPIVRTVDQPTWSEFAGLTKKQVSAVWKEIGNRRWFWYLLKPLVKEATFQRINNLRRMGVDVYFVTARHTGLMLRDQTELWLKVYGVTGPTVVFTDNKWGFADAVSVTHAIDDKLENAINVGLYGGARSYLLDRPYNRQAVDGNTEDDTAYARVAAVEDFLNDVEEAIRANSRDGRVTKDDGGGGSSTGASETRGLQAA